MLETNFSQQIQYITIY